jgi:hypothetical protein
MKYFGRNLRALLAMAVVVTLAAISIPQPRPLAAAGSAPVIVTNTPLPVQGTVGAAQSGPWNVGISGTPTVNVSSLPAVQFSGTVATTQSGAWNVGINNAATNPVPVRDMDNAARRVPFQTHVFASLTNGAENGTGTLDLSLELTSGKGFVIEHLSASGVMPTGQKASLLVVAGPLISTAFRHRFVLEPQGTDSNGNDHFVASTPFHAFVDSSMSLAASIDRLATSNSGQGDVTVFVSGYLVDCGAGSGCPIP